MEKKLTKKDIINDLIDVLMGNSEYDDMQIFIDYLVHERELLEKKASSKTLSSTQKENIALVEDIYNILTEEPMSIKDIQSQLDKDLSNQKISSLLKKLIESGKAERVTNKKAVFFKRV